MTQRDMRDFYQRYPYPKVTQLEYDLNIHDHFRYLGYGCHDNPAPRKGTKRARMLIAGCGTSEAILWGASLPQFDIDAVDLSARSIDISKALTEQLQVTNVTFRRGNFENGEGLDGPYDFISSFGVLHHLSNPERGLAQLERVLKPGGMMALMVYSESNRGPIQRAQRVISLLSPSDTPDGFETGAAEICKTGMTRKNRLQQVFKAGVSDYENNREHFADTLLNPREVAYTIPSLVDYLATAGLEMISPAQPIAWDPLGVLPPDAYKRLRELPLLQRMEIADSLTAPLFWVLTHRASEPLKKRVCATSSALFWDRVIMPMDTGIWPVDNLVPMKQPIPIVAKMTPLENDMVLIARQDKHKRAFHRIAWRMVQGFDGERTLREIGHEAAKAEGTEFDLVKDTLAGFLNRLIDEMAIGTPDVTKCERCPSRKSGEC